MTTTSTKVQRCRAPCGQVVDAEHYQEEEEGCHVADNWHFACGCRTITHEFTDGSIQHKEIHHNHTVLVDDLDAEHHP
jgi:hypothetical protein